MQSLDIHAFTYEHRQGVLHELTSALIQCGGWVLERKTLSTDHVEFQLEIQILGVLDLYAGILATGVEFTRAGHDALTALCTRRKHLARTADLGQIVAIRLELAFLDDITLHSLLCAGASLA